MPQSDNVLGDFSVIHGTSELFQGPVKALAGNRLIGSRDRGVIVSHIIRQLPVCDHLLNHGDHVVRNSLRAHDGGSGLADITAGKVLRGNINRTRGVGSLRVKAGRLRLQIIVGGVQASRVSSTQTVRLRLLHVPDRQGLGLRRRGGAGNAFLGVDIGFVRCHGLAIHGSVALRKHIVENELHRLGGCYILLSLVVNDALCRVNNLVSRKPGFIHSRPQRSGCLRALIDAVPLERPLIAPGHGEL